MLYLIECSHRDGNRAATIRDICDGQVEDVNRVLCIAPDGTWTDATKEIAQAILDELDESPNWDLQNFLEHALGLYAVASVLREMKRQTA